MQAVPGMAAMVDLEKKVFGCHFINLGSSVVNLLSTSKQSRLCSGILIVRVKVLACK